MRLVLTEETVGDMLGSDESNRKLVSKYVDHAHQVEMLFRSNVLYTLRVFLKLVVSAAHYSWVVVYFGYFFTLRYISFILNDMVINGYLVRGLMSQFTGSGSGLTNPPSASLYEVLL